MNANDYFEDFEARLKRLLASTDMYRMRPANNALLISFKEKSDFLAAVRSASGVNIAVEIGWLFEPKQPQHFDMECCYLRLQLTNGCVDERLGLFLEDLSLRVPDS